MKLSLNYRLEYPKTYKYRKHIFWLKTKYGISSYVLSDNYNGFRIDEPFLVNMGPVYINLKCENHNITPRDKEWLKIFDDTHIKIGGITKLNINSLEICHKCGIKLIDASFFHKIDLKSIKSQLYVAKFKDSHKITSMSISFNLLNDYFNQNTNKYKFKFKIKHITTTLSEYIVFWRYKRKVNYSHTNLLHL